MSKVELSCGSRHFGASSEGAVSPVGFRGCAFLLQLPRGEGLHLGGLGKGKAL